MPSFLPRGPGVPQTGGWRRGSTLRPASPVVVARALENRLTLFFTVLRRNLSCLFVFSLWLHIYIKYSSLPSSGLEASVSRWLC